jgi:hypothetical protein
MKDTNRSLLIAMLACLAMGFFAKSPQFAGSRSWITDVLLFATFGLSAWGFWVGLRGARQQRTAWSWLAPAINALIFIAMALFWGAFLMALEDFQ